MKLHAIIVDDEYLAIKILEEYALRIPEFIIDKTFIDPENTLAYLSNHQPDILFLDVQMPHLTGFELLKKVHSPPLVIFTTARHDYAVKAFELDVVDYLVKPISFDRFQKAVTRAQEYLRYKNTKALNAGYIMIRADHRIHKVMLDEIEYIEGLGEYIKLHAKDKMHITYAALKDLLLQLPSESFTRIHKSFIISKNQIKSYSSQSVQLINGKELPVGRGYKDSFIEWSSGIFNR